MGNTAIVINKITERIFFMKTKIHYFILLIITKRSERKLQIGLHLPKMSNPHLQGDGENSDKEFENSIRPSSIDDFSGQDELITNIKIFDVNTDSSYLPTLKNRTFEEAE